MIILSQRDPRWSFKTIGQSRLTIGDQGCVITDLAMLSDWYGLYRDPSWMAKRLQFTPGGLLLWQSITESELPFRFVWRFYKYNEDWILPALKSNTGACLLQIRSNHWVVGIRKIGSYYWVADPWDAKRKLISKSIITGGAVMDKK